MENKSDKKYKWRGIFLWSLVPASMVSIPLYLFKLSDFNIFDPAGKLLFGVRFLLFTSWGVITGLSYKDKWSFFSEIILIKNAFWILLLTILFSNMFFGVWHGIIDPIEDMGFIENALRSGIFFSPFVSLPIAVPFFAGFIPAIVVRFFSNKISNYNKAN